MARKKKNEDQVIAEVAKLIAEETLQATDPVVVKVEKGSHLTVTRYSDGRTSLQWDDEALMRDVQEALASVSTASTEKKTKTKKVK